MPDQKSPDITKVTPQPFGRDEAMRHLEELLLSGLEGEAIQLSPPAWSALRAEAKGALQAKSRIRGLNE